MRVVRNIVDTGRTITCTIHQPSVDIFEVRRPPMHLLTLCLNFHPAEHFISCRHCSQGQIHAQLLGGTSFESKLLGGRSHAQLHCRATAGRT